MFAQNNFGPTWVVFGCKIFLSFIDDRQRISEGGLFKTLRSMGQSEWRGWSVAEAP